MNDHSPLCLGLHITKCAGTSLMTTIRHALPEDRYYFFSSYRENWLCSRPCFEDIEAPERLQIAFGHYCHETLLRIFEPRPVFLFTGLREPVSCAISGFRQFNAVRFQTGRAPASAEEFLSTHRNPICSEILRCFPSLAAGDGPLWTKARGALSLFDFIYATESFEDDAKILFAAAGIPVAKLIPDNVSDTRDMPSAYRDHIDAECLLVHRGARDALGDDLRLWMEIHPYLSLPSMRHVIAGESWTLDRAAFVQTLPPLDRARDIFRKRERDFMGHEFDELGQVDELRRSLARRIANAQTMLEHLRG